MIALKQDAITAILKDILQEIVKKDLKVLDTDEEVEAEVEAEVKVAGEIETEEAEEDHDQENVKEKDQETEIDQDLEKSKFCLLFNNLPNLFLYSFKYTKNN